MTLDSQQRQAILVLEDIEETAYLIEKMLKRSGYCVTLARSEEDAIFRGRFHSPDLILMSLGMGPERLLAIANRIRRQAGLSQDVAVVIFCIPTIPEGAEMEVDKNIYMTRPDNFNNLENSSTGLSAGYLLAKFAFSRSTDQTIQLIIHHSVTFTDRSFQTFAIEDRNMSPGIMDQTCILQTAGRYRHALASTTEHISYELLRHLNF